MASWLCRNHLKGRLVMILHPRSLIYLMPCLIPVTCSLVEVVLTVTSPSLSKTFSNFISIRISREIKPPRIKARSWWKNACMSNVPSLECWLVYRIILGGTVSWRAEYPRVFLEVMQPILLDIGLYMAPTKWGQFSIKNLLNITHKQWIFRNSKVHYGCLDGLTKA